MEVNYNLRVATNSGERKVFALRLDAENSNEKHIMGFLQSRKAYEPDVTTIVNRILEPGDIFIDVGANVGYFTTLGATLVGPEGKVFAFEPDPKNINRIRYHLANNKLENVEIVSRPASSAVEDVKFYFNKSSSGGNALWNPGEFFGDPEFNDGFSIMKSTTLTNEFARLGLEKVKLIKIDTEGAEHAILRGTQDWLKDQSVPYIIAELNKFGLEKLGTSTEEFISFMYDSGYLGFLLYFDGRPPQFVCPGTEVNTACISNLLFTTTTGFAKIWKGIVHNPGVVRGKGGELVMAA